MARVDLDKVAEGIELLIEREIDRMLDVSSELTDKDAVKLKNLNEVLRSCMERAKERGQRDWTRDKPTEDLESLFND